MKVRERNGFRPVSARTYVCMGPRNPQSRNRARTLREQGWALRPIANEVGVALSTVSLWVRDIPRPAGVEPLSDDAEVSASPEAQALLGGRRCAKCCRELPLTSFNRHPAGYQWWCRDCYRAYFRARSERHRSQVRVARTNRRDAARRFVADYLGARCCSACREADPVVLEFHHLGTKRDNIADLVRRGCSVRSLDRELAGCVVLCANCHRLTTAKSKGSWRLAPESLDEDFRLTPAERRNLRYLRDRLMRSMCVDCGDPRLVVLEFDHVDKKDANVTELARRGCAIWRLEAEVARCEVRCVNCHRRRTATVAGSGFEESIERVAHRSQTSRA
jgi:hypothetical protein